MKDPDAARPGRDQPRPHTRLTVPTACRMCRPARSAFFDSRIGVADARHPVRAVAQRYASFTPGAALLPAQAGLVQGAPDRERADPRQPIRGLAQGFLQQAQGPGGGAIMLALGRSRPLGQNALLRVSPIADLWPTPMVGPHGRQSLTVEAADPGRDGLVMPASDPMRRGGVAGSISNRQQGTGAVNLGGGSRLRAAQTGQLLVLVRGEGAQGIFPVARHGTPRIPRITTPLYHVPRQ